MSRVMKTMMRANSYLTSTNSSKKEKKEKMLRKVTVKIGLKQKDDKEGIVVEALLDSGVTGLVMSLEFARKNKFKKKKLDRPIYIRNMDSIFNHEELIKYTVEVELYYREYKKRAEIDVIVGQKWSVILEIYR